MGFPFHGGCLYPVRSFFQQPLLPPPGTIFPARNSRPPGRKRARRKCGEMRGGHLSGQTKQNPISCCWRVVFRFEDGEAVDVDLIDYH